MTTTEGEYNPNRQHSRTKANKKCILRIAGMDTVGWEAMFVETLNISSKEAEVVWLKQLNGDCATGLRWV